LITQENISQIISEVGGRLRVRSALNPALWLCAITTLPASYIMAGMTNPPYWLIIIATAPVIAAIFGFLFLLIYDRDKLQSEDYQIKKKSLELIQEKGQKFPISAPSIEAIANPHYGALPPVQKKENR
jgi:hypothetical protein